MKKKKHIIFNFFKSFFQLQLSKRLRPFDKKRLLKKWYKPSTLAQKSTDPVITWVGHATFLIQIAGINILTDPIFYNISPIFFRRITPPGINIKNLPKIDAIVISHDHADHMHRKTLSKLAKDNPFIFVPKGTGDRLARLGFKKITEHNWEDNSTISNVLKEKIVFTFLPATHWTGSNIFNIHKSMHGSWMIKHKNESIYFAGDSAYGKHFCEISQKFPDIGTALLPIGPIEPRHIAQSSHLDSIEAVKSFIDLKAKHLIPMHWGTFYFGMESFEEPIIRLKKCWENLEQQLKDKKLSIVKLGESRKISF
jgi:L-ascorbate metabolism protein UlaG (beta-lactamase superfamily)